MSDVAEHIVREDDRPVPIRYWWLKRLALAGVVMVLGLVALRLWWGYEAKRRLDVVIAGYRAAGQMVDAAEFDAVLDAVPDEDNAAILYEEAMGKIVSTSTSGVGYEEFNTGQTLIEAKHADALELMTLNAEVIALVRAAQLRKQVAWSDRLSVNPFPFSNMTILSRQRKLAKFLWFGANYHMQRGEYGESIQYIRDLWVFSDDVIEHPKIISFLVGVRCHEIAYITFEELIWDLATREAPIDSEAQVQMQRFLDVLQDKVQYMEIAENAYLGERANNLRTIDLFDNVANAKYRPSSWDEVLMDFFARPVLILATLRLMDYYSEAALSLHAPTWRSAVGILNWDKAKSNLLANFSRSFFADLIFSFSYSLEGSRRLIFRQLARRRMVMAGLAAKIFEIEQGRWPISLDELVPDYLPEVPLDPFGEVDDRLKYIVEDGRVLIYSVDMDGVDDDGDKWDYKAKKGDRAFYLKGKPEEKTNK